MKFAKLNHAKNLKCLVLTLPSYHLLPFQSGVSPKNPPQHPKSLHRAMVANFRPTFGRSQQTWLSRNTAIVAANFMVRVLASGGLVYYGLLRGGGVNTSHLNTLTEQRIMQSVPTNTHLDSKSTHQRKKNLSLLRLEFQQKQIYHRHSVNNEMQKTLTLVRLCNQHFQKQKKTSSNIQCSCVCPQRHDSGAPKCNPRNAAVGVIAIFAMRLVLVESGRNPLTSFCYF